MLIECSLNDFELLVFSNQSHNHNHVVAHVRGRYLFNNPREVV